MTIREATLPLDPHADVEVLDACLQAAGWVREPDRAGMNQGRPEPAFVSWSLPLADGEIDYSFDADTGFRLVEIRGAEAASWAAVVQRAVPVARARTARELLGSAEPARIRQGLRMAMALRDPSLSRELVALLRHPDPIVQQEARELAARVAPGGGPSSGPGEVTFDALVEVHQRRQVLRWMLRDFAADARVLRSVLRRALGDPDWEIRAAAMIGVARGRLAELAPLVDGVELPVVSRLGPGRRDRQILQGIRKAVLLDLAGVPLREPAAGDPPQAFAVHRLRRAVAGHPGGPIDHLTVFVQALSQPVEVTASFPATLPYGVQSVGDTCRLAGTDLELRYVAPVPHWLGDDDPEMPTPNPIRRSVPGTGFFVMAGLARDPLALDRREPALVTFEEALALGNHLARLSGASLRLPAGEEWEMALRGPDGRRFPWGNGYEATWMMSSSPWGCLEVFGAPPQWTDDADGRTGGGPEVRACAHFQSRSRTEPGTCRFVVPVPSP